MINAKTYKQAREILFTRLIWVATIGISLTSTLNLFNANYNEFYLSISFLILIGIVWLTFKKISKKASYHVLLLFFVLILCYPIIFQGKSYYAIIIYPIAALIYNFVFFDNKKVLWFYLGLFAILQFFLLKSSMKIDLANIPEQFYAEYINAVVYMICVFFIGNYFISNLRKQQDQLSLAKSDMEEKSKELSQKNETLDKYIESNIQLESFAHLAAHELKAPLRSISGFAGLLRKKIQNKLTPEEDDMFRIISSSNRKMHDMISALNQLGSVSKMKLNPSEFDIHELISEITFDRQEAIKDSNAVINTEVDSPLIYADRTLMKQLVSNLVGNALKFVDKDQQPEICISVEKKDEQFVFKLDDNGIGIKEEDRPKIFKLFERLNGSNSYSGSGIGLAICQKIVELHEGEIWVEASPMNGSRFLFTIPLK